MYGYNPVERINNQIMELEKMKTQIPAPITQNFQIASNNSMRYVSSPEEIEKALVLTSTPFFNKEMTQLWVKEASGEVKTYELKEIIKKDEKDLQIEFLMAKIKELEETINAKPNVEYVAEPIEDEKPSNVSVSRTSKKDK